MLTGRMVRPPQVFVESLDSAFENVCELDLVFHFDEVRRAASHHLPYIHFLGL